MTLSVSPIPPDSAVQRAHAQKALYDAAIELEATFLAEMLKSAGLGKVSETFGGGAGESQFGSFLVEAQAREMARSGGIGLAETLFTSLLERNHDA